MAARGRGRLTAIDMLPEACSETIAWAAAELSARKRTQLDIYAEFVSRLETVERENRGEVEFKIPSFSAFNRHSLRLAAMTRRLEETRQITEGLVERFDATTSDNITIMAAEAIKTLVYELLDGAGEAGFAPKDAVSLAKALHAAVTAQNVSSERRARIEREFKGKVDAAIEKAGKAAGQDGAEVLKKIREDIYGIFER